MVLSIQSVRLYRKTRVRPALLFAAFYFFYALLSLVSALVLLKSGVYAEGYLYILYVVSLAAIQLICTQLVAYTTIRNKLASLLFLLMGVVSVCIAALVYIPRVGEEFFKLPLQSGPPAIVFVLSVLPLLITLSAVFVTVRQIKEIAGQPLAAFRLVLISLSIASVALLTLIGSLQLRSAYVYTLFDLILALLAVILMLSSLLTPIGGKKEVERSIY